jgi:hypothetical protein
MDFLILGLSRLHMLNEMLTHYKTMTVDERKLLMHAASQFLSLRPSPRSICRRVDLKSLTSLNSPSPLTIIRKDIEYFRRLILFPACRQRSIMSLNSDRLNFASLPLQVINMISLKANWRMKEATMIAHIRRRPKNKPNKPNILHPSQKCFRRFLFDSPI